MTEQSVPASVPEAAGRSTRARVLAAIRALGRGLPALEPRGPVFALFCALLLSQIAYRLTLIYHLTHDRVTPFSFVPLFHNNTAIVRCFAFDVGMIAALCAALGAVGFALRALLPARYRPGLTRLGRGVRLLVAALAGLGAGAQLRTLLAMHSGLDALLLLEAMQAGAQRALLVYAKPWDLGLAALPVALLFALERTPARLERPRLYGAAALSVVCLLAYLPYLENEKRELPVPKLNPALRWMPLYYAASGLAEHFTRTPGNYESLAESLPALEARGLYVDGVPPSPPSRSGDGLEPAPGERFNVVLVIMESTGADYVFDVKHKNPMPMPRLRELAGQGLYLNRHYAASNTSPRAIFALYTGLYPPPTDVMFVTRPDIFVPGIRSWLGAGYDSFFVTPSRLQFYMPNALIEHDGVREIYGLENMPVVHPNEKAGTVALDELQAADVFLSRLARAKEPFFATYYSFAPHFEYYDYGPEYRIFRDLDSPQHRYYNNLRLLDVQISRIVSQLAARGQLERTVLVFVGDHGEAFGQHPDNFTHAEHSFEENLRAPALFWQPRLFKPARIDVPTSHVDLLPTLLDALAIRYDPTRFSGVSLLRGTPTRKYVYAWGNEGTLSSIAGSGRKLQISFERDHCWYYELVRDPKERSARDCAEVSDPQLEDALRFWKFQRIAVAGYNQRLEAQARGER